MIKILIAGSTGTLGYGLNNYMSALNRYKIIQHGFKNASKFNINFTKKNDVLKFLKDIKPDIIINLCCLSNVDECEKKLHKALEYNSEIIKNLNLWAVENNSKIIHLSTDQVYDKKDHYNKEEETNIKNNYAYSKFIGEKNLNKENCCILRTNFFGYSKSKKTLNEWLLNSIEKENDIDLFYDVQFNPVLMDTLYECIDYIIQNFRGGIFNFGCEIGLAKSEFCKLLLKKLNINYNKIKLVSVDQSELFAYRPKGMMMNNQKFINNFNFKIPNINEEIKKYIQNYCN